MEAFQDVASSNSHEVSQLRSRQIRARTARRWLKKMGFSFGEVKKDVYVDGHEREDVVKYRNEEFLPAWKEFSRRMVVFKEDGTWEKPLGLHPDEKPLVLITQDESTFNANDGKRQVWTENGKQPLRPKGRGKGIMVSGFLTPGGVLKVANNVSKEDLLHQQAWPCDDDNGEPIREALLYLEYGKDNYWTGEKMVNHTANVAIPIFEQAFPGCQGLFAFDNASNHSSFATDALLAVRMNLGPGGKQPLLRDGFDCVRGAPQRMVFDDGHPLAGKAKGIKVVLQERGLWRERQPNGSKFCLTCPKPGCDPTHNGDCCATTLLQSQKDFQEQRGWLQEKVEAAGHRVIFYPKFHCETNFIERFWCSAKHYARENCDYSLVGLRKTVPLSLKSVPTATINRYFNRCKQTIEAYDQGFQYGTKEFSQQIQYKSHRQVVDNSKW